MPGLISIRCALLPRSSPTLFARPIALTFDKFGMTKLKATTFAIRDNGPTN
jgi:hypothetical protein